MYVYSVSKDGEQVCIFKASLRFCLYNNPLDCSCRPKFNYISLFRSSPSEIIKRYSEHGREPPKGPLHWVPRSLTLTVNYEAMYQLQQNKVSEPSWISLSITKSKPILSQLWTESHRTKGSLKKMPLLSDSAVWRAWLPCFLLPF